VAVPLAIDAGAFVGLDRHARVRQLNGATMGTTWSVRYVAPESVNLDALRHAIEARLEAIVAEMSHWLPTSLLSGFNRAAAGSWVALPADFAAVMAAGIKIAEKSDGTFDPTVGRLVDLWGYGATPRSVAPGDAELTAAVRDAGWRRLAFDVGASRIRQPGGLWLDLSGIAKGFAVDAIAELLADAGVVHCLVEIGGEFVGRGIRPDGEPWWVDLETSPDVSLPPLRVALHQMAVATSGDYVRGPHTIDPQTGRPVGNDITVVSVLHSSAMVADAWASALTVMGMEAAITVASWEDLAVRIVAREGDGAVEWISPALDRML
jgi:thiamine biosynthesis lipoprotein